jgi:hypothetical protein
VSADIGPSHQVNWVGGVILTLVAATVLGGVGMVGKAVLDLLPERSVNAERGGRPGAVNTGVPEDVKLKAAGAISVTRKGTVIEGLDIHGALDIYADDVVVRNCRIRGRDFWGIRVHDGVSGVRVEDSTIAPSTASSQMDGIRAEGAVTAVRLDITRTSDGIKAGSGTRVEASWIHGLTNGPGDHSDAVQILSGTGISLVGNTLEGASNAAVMASSEYGSINGLAIEGNWLAGGNFTLNLRQGPYGPLKGLRVSGNRFTKTYKHGPAAIDGHFEQSGNVWAADDKPVKL